MYMGSDDITAVSAVVVVVVTASVAHGTRLTGRTVHTRGEAAITEPTRKHTHTALSD